VLLLESDTLTRIFEHLLSRASGPMHIRLLLQPTMALIFGIRDGMKDAREERSPYFWALFREPQRRRELLRSGWKSVGKVFVLAVVLDAIYQLIAFRWFYPGEAFLTAFILACIPYLLIRGPLNRLLRAKRKRATDLRQAA
jgi:hypothetical protein